MKCLVKDCIYNVDDGECLANSSLNLNSFKACCSSIRVSPVKKALFDNIYQVKGDGNGQKAVGTEEEKQNRPQSYDSAKTSNQEEKSNAENVDKAPLLHEINVTCDKNEFNVLYGKSSRGILFLIPDWDIYGFLTDNFYNLKEHVKQLKRIFIEEFNDDYAEFAAKTIATTIACKEYLSSKNNQ